MAIVPLAGAVPNFQSRMIFDPLNITKNQPQNAHAVAYSPDRNLGLIPSFEESCRIDRWDSGLDGWAHNCSLRRGGSGAPLYSDESDGYRHLHCISCKERQVVAAGAKLEPETTLPYIFGFNNNLGTDLGMIPRDLLSRFGMKVTPAGYSP